MRKPTTCLAGLFALAFVFSCQSKKQESSTAQPLVLENRIIRQQIGTDCDKQPDTKRKDCATIDFSTPKIPEAGAPNALSNNVHAWTDKFLIRLLAWSDYSEPDQEAKTLDTAIQRFRANHAENKGAVFSGMVKATCIYHELLNDGKYLTLMLDGFSFQGGNRALEEQEIATFDVSTGKQLTFEDLVKNKAALLPPAHAKVRETRADAFSEGFEFDKAEPFTLPGSYGLTGEGILFHYQPGEISRLGGTTEFTIPYSELGANLKIAAPALPAGDTGSDASQGIYKVQGNDLVIPTFEIEVNSSAAADKMLARKKETIIVSAILWAEPLDPKEKAKGLDGLISVLNKEIELSGDQRIARFEGLKFDKSLLNKMEDKDIVLLINIYSGRKSSDNNLLDCDILEMKASQFGNKRFVLGCKLIGETTKGGTVASGYPEACFALPQTGPAPNQPLPFLVDCSEKGSMAFAGRPIKSYEELMAILRPLLAGMIKDGFKVEELPGIQTAGCTMGNSGAIGDYYEELKSEFTEKAKPATIEKTDRKITAVQKGNTLRPAQVAKSPRTPTVTLKQNGAMLVNGREVPDLESLRKVLQEVLLKETVIPDKLSLTTVGQTGMGMRGEMNTIIGESIAGAKWVRKKTAIATLNTAVGKKLGTATQLELGSYHARGNFAYINARPKQADGRPIDYSRTTYADAYASGKFADNTIGLLQYEKGAWKILIYNIGVSKPPADIWAKKYKAPKALFVSTAGK